MFLLLSPLAVDSFSSIIRNRSTPITIPCRVNTHLLSNNRREFLEDSLKEISFGIAAISGIVLGSPSLTLAAVDDLAMPSAEEQKKIDDVSAFLASVSVKEQT
jgi:hypothetical protein